MKHTLSVATLIAGLMTMTAATAGQIDLQVTGFTTDAGTARILLFKGEAGYRGEIEAERVVSVAIRDGKATWRAEDLSEGAYSIIAHHDTNANDDLDRPYFSLPLEPYGYSNGAWTSAGLPDWPEVAFDVGAAPVQQSIHIRMNAFAALAQMALIGVPSLLVIFGGLALFRRRRVAHI